MHRITPILSNDCRVYYLYSIVTETKLLTIPESFGPWNSCEDRGLGGPVLLQRPSTMRSKSRPFRRHTDSGRTASVNLYCCVVIMLEAKCHHQHRETGVETRLERRSSFTCAEPFQPFRWNVQNLLAAAAAAAEELALAAAMRPSVVPAPRVLRVRTLLAAALARR